jgi:DNA-binding winged helix-turn-helix (wHTH) protein
VSMPQQVSFGPFRFELTAARLWRGEREIVLRAQAKAVLRYLLRHPGRVIAREKLVQQVWAGTHVSKTVLQVCIGAARHWRSGTPP